MDARAAMMNVDGENGLATAASKQQGQMLKILEEAAQMGYLAAT